jgi:hypothetical protein
MGISNGSFGIDGRNRVQTYGLFCVREHVDPYTGAYIPCCLVDAQLY